VTGFARYTPSARNKELRKVDKQFTQLIDMHGGERINTLNDARDFVEHFSDRHEHVLVVISDRPLRTAKFMFSLARGLPVIHSKWLSACIEAKKIVAAHPFALACRKQFGMNTGRPVST